MVSPAYVGVDNATVQTTNEVIDKIFSLELIDTESLLYSYGREDDDKAPIFSFQEDDVVIEFRRVKD